MAGLEGRDLRTRGTSVASIDSIPGGVEPFEPFFLSFFGAIKGKK